ncbi:MAG: HAMP domain-containing histidine kinase [Candidatus Sumerlaeaceae bacterium]|nr:HAMP domain-containing histidine kinase [Candidatus Sumerlaeaceae bacterium]
MSTGRRRPSKQLLSQELTLQEQVHVALGSASTLDDFYVILCCMLADPNGFGFSRAFLLRYDEVQRTFVGRLAVGATSAKDHRRLRREIAEEARRLEEQVEIIKSISSEARVLQPLYDLRFHSLWIHFLQERDSAGGLNDMFRQVRLSEAELSANHLLRVLASQARPTLFENTEKVGIEGLEEFIRAPFLGGRLATKRGLHAIIIADRSFELRKIDEGAMYHFQWLLNHASVTLENVELLEELRETTARLQEVDRIKSNFLSIISHELRTPLTSIVGFVQILQEEKAGALTNFQRDLLRRVAYHAAHLQSMVNDLIEIAQVEGGGMINVHMQAVDPLSALLKTLPKIESRRGSKPISIEPIVTSEVPLVRTDPNALERIFFHLLDNAVKFIPDQGHVRIFFLRRDDWLDIAIEDTGIGISSENLRRIFDYFYQVDSRLERVYGGMGIGLTIVKLLLDATGGQIRAESTPGVGSRFTVSYPIASAAVAPDAFLPTPGL